MAIDTTLAVSSITYSSRTNSTLSKPSGTTVGDDLIAPHYIESSATVTPPSGWTQISDVFDLGSGCYARVYHRRIDSSDDAVTDYTWTHANTPTQAAIKLFRGCDGTTILDCAISYIATYANTFVPITTVTDGAALIGIPFNVGGQTFSGWTAPLVEYFDGGQFAIGSGIQAVAGSTGTLSVTEGSHGRMLLALRPAIEELGTISQHSFQAFNNDGDESGSTAKAELNTDIILAPGDIFLLRHLLDATGNPGSIQIQGEYRRRPSGGSWGGWKKAS